ncbi:MAG: signal peptidase II [Acidobacteria bacterium]|nr:signal peptidase II [Acidobacteriota bacterium]
MRRPVYLSISLAIIVADWITKLLVVRKFALYDSRPVIDGFFHLVYVRNTGAAFGLGANSGNSLVPFLLNGGAITIFFAVAFIAFRSPLTETRLQAGLHLILGGAVGNLIDRFRLGYVIDFLDFFVVVDGKPYHWPAFNVADSAICVGIVLLLLDMWRKPEPSEAKA